MLLDNLHNIQGHAILSILQSVYVFLDISSYYTSPRTIELTPRKRYKMLFLFRFIADRWQRNIFRYIDSRGHEEIGDVVGMSSLIRFWCEVTDNLLIGERGRVPCVCHDYFEKEWGMIAKIIVYNIKEVGYFPVLFCMYCLNFPIEKRVMNNSFMTYLSHQEKELIEGALKDDVTMSFCCQKIP